MKTVLIFGIIILAIGVWFFLSKSSLPESDIISRNGIHWHAHLTIKISGQDQKIPSDIGLGITHQPLHTHEEDGVIHMEFAGLVKKDDIKIGRFFQIWGKDFPRGKMLVNGKESGELENYIMRDKDEIEIVSE